MNTRVPSGASSVIADCSLIYNFFIIHRATRESTKRKKSINIHATPKQNETSESPEDPFANSPTHFESSESALQMCLAINGNGIAGRVINEYNYIDFFGASHVLVFVSYHELSKWAEAEKWPSASQRNIIRSPFHGPQINFDSLHPSAIKRLRMHRMRWKY